MNNPAYSHRFIPVLWQNLRDRLQGNQARANARMGRVRPPEGQGRLIWIRAGSAFASVKLAAQIMGAIRGKRQDVRLVLTFEEDLPEAYRHELEGVEKIGLGFGPCDRRSAIQRFLQRMQPMGVITVGDQPGHNLIQLLARHSTIKSMLVHTDDLVPVPGLVQYPWWGQSMPEVTDGLALEPACELITLLVQNQLEPTLRNVIHGPDADEGFFWMHLAPEAVLPCLQLWQQHPLSERHSLIVSVEGAGPFGLEQADAGFDYTVRLSEWDRKPLAPGALIWMDSWAWAGAVAVASSGNWLHAQNRWLYWQALAGSRPLLSAFAALAPDSENIARVDAPEAVLTTWAHWLDDQVSTRALIDRNRRMFWDARRRTNEVLETILQRVYDW